MRIRSLVVMVLLALAVAVYWAPIKLRIGDGEVMLGGYPWMAPTSQARRMFTVIGILLIIAAVTLAVIELKLSKDLETFEEESFGESFIEY